MDELRKTLLDRVQRMPKVELHRHLEGSMRLSTLLDIAHKHDRELANITLDELRPHVQMVPGQQLSVGVFLGKFKTLRQFYNSPQTIRRIAREAVIDAAEDNIKYMELRFTPRALCNVLACGYEQAMDWVCDTIAQAATDEDITVKLIVSMNRHEGVNTAEEVTEIALAYQDRGVVGIDLAGDETAFSCKPFERVFRKARAGGLAVTVHAGEWAGPQSVRDSIDYLGAERIGHGIRANEDETLIKTLVDRQIVLEVCPTSNLHSGVVNDLDQHPLIDLYRAGIRTTINTDDPLISNVTLTTELLDTMFAMKFTLEQIKHQTLNAVDGAFLPNGERVALRSQFADWYAQLEEDSA